MSVKLTPRLLTALPYVCGGRLLADIGTDHAYLPIHLCEAGILTPVTVKNGERLSAIAADINKGPVERARLHVAAAGLSDRIRTVQTDGLHGLEVYDPEDIVIFGMGGELIASILDAAPWARTRGKRLILQPMTHADRLRAYLREAGLTVTGEALSREGERIYQTLCAERTVGEAPAPMTAAELAVGKAALHRQDADQKELYRELIRRTLRTERAARDARRRAGQATEAADSLIAELEALLATIA